MIVKTILAYVIVIALGHFAVTVGMIVVGTPLSFILLFLPNTLRITICGFLGGIGGSLLLITFGYFVFKLLVGPDSFGVIQFVVSALPLAITMSNDLNFYRKVRQSRLNMLGTLEGQAATAVGKLSAPDVITRQAALIGNLCGIPIAAYWFFLR